MALDIPSLRLRNHGLAAPVAGSPKAVVAWMGAVQAQDLPMAKWAVGIRLRNTTEAGVDAGLDGGGIIRIHALRPTWHLLAVEDVRWIMELTAPNILKTLAGRHKELELTGPVLAQSRRVLEKALRDGRRSTREELLRELDKAGIATANNRGWHLLVRAELDMLVCSAESKGGKPTYALMDERVPPQKSLPREEALARLAERYYTSHGPAQEKDFVWWSGLSVREAKLALEPVKSKFVSADIGGRTFWFRGRTAARRSAKVFLLPAFDEYLIGYADRSDATGQSRQREAVSSNGVFWPTIVVGGQVAGLWKRSVRKGVVTLDFGKIVLPDREASDAFQKAAARLRAFWGLTASSKPV